MKRENSKKSQKWLWLVGGAALLLIVVGVLLAIFLTQGQQSGPADGIAELYWNVDRAFYTETSEVEGLSAREAAEDGNYYIRFAFEGAQVELQVVDKQLVNYIDSMDVMGLVFNADGVVVDAVPADSVATEVAKGFFVQKVGEDSVIVNSSQAINGMELELVITENTGIYDVAPTAEKVGQITKPDIMDQVLVYADADGAVTHIYITAHPVDAEIYWRVERCYDAEEKLSTRIPDEDGVYTIEFANRGKIVELKCRDKALVNNIDSKAILSGQFAFLFDEEGYIIDTVDIALTLRGKYLASDYHVTAIEGDTYTLTKLSTGNMQGDVITMTLTQDCEIFQCCQWMCYEHNCGEYTDHLNLYDRVNVYSNLEGEAIMIFVTRRMIGEDVKLYYNYDRQYGGDATGTMRTKQNGYYVFEMLLDGELVTVRVKDKEMADAIDKPYNRSVGLVLDGDIVTKVYNPSCAIGGPNYANETPVTSMTGPMVTFTYSDSSTRNFMMSADCKIYNAITGEYGKKIGGKMDLQVGDVVIAFTDYKDELALVYVVSRPVEGAKIYYNLSRRYDSTLKQTTREPDAEGYYVFLMACEGEQVTVKTKDKGMATFIDSQSAPLAGLKVNSQGIITNAYAVTAVLQKETKVCNYHYVKDLNSKKGTFGTYYIIDGVRTDPTAVQTLAKDCVIYNVSSTFENFRGEKSTLRNGDQIQGIKNITTGEVTKIFIMQRDPTYGFESYKANCSHCGKTVTWQPYGGNIAAADGHYYACGDFTLKQGNVGVSDDDKVYDIVIDLKGHKILSTGRAFLVYDNLTVMDSVGGGQIAGTTPSGDLATIGSTIMVMEGSELNILGGNLTLSEKSTMFGSLGGVVYVQPGATMNMSGGSITGGISNSGGNVYVGGTFNMTGGTISGGTAPLGKNIAVANTGTLNISGGTVDGGIYMGSGKVTLSGKPVITGTGLQLTAGKKISVEGLTTGASVVVDGDGIFTDALTNAESYLVYFKPAAEKDKISVENNALSYYKQPADYNSVDNSNLSFAEGTTSAYCPICEKTVTWTALTADKALTMDNGEHYYLASDLTYAGNKDSWFLTAPGTGKTACLHLNGHNMTCTNNRVIQGSTGTLNIMGNGTVTGGWTTTGYILGGTVGINTSGASGKINLIGGTYVTSAPNTPVVAVSDNGGTINMYNGATIRGSASNAAVHIGKAGLVNGVFNMYGGTVEGGAINISGADTTKGNSASVLLSGGKVTSGVNVSANCQVAISGNPVVKDLVIPKGLILELGTLTQGADITIGGNGVFTEALENAEAVKAYFTAAGDDDEIIVLNNALAYAAKKPDGGLDLDENGYAQCEHCGESVQWTEITGGLGTVTDTTKHHHYYLGGNVTLATGALMSINDKAEVCLHLNGYTVTQKGWINVISGKLSILNGTAATGGIIGTHNNYNTINVSWGTLNIYGGTYSYAGSGDLSTIQLGQTTSKLNLYGGNVVGGIDVNKGVLTLSKTATVTGAENQLTGNIYVAADGKLLVKSDYTGTASVTFASLTDNTIPVANGASEGAFAGKLYLEAENSPEIIGEGTKLVLKTEGGEGDGNDDGSGDDEQKPAGGLDLDENGYAQCEHCGESVQWTAVTGGLGTITDTSKHHHYYLTGNMTLSNGSLMLVNGGANVCLHLNGYTVTQNGWINVISGTLSVMNGTAATGGIIGNHASYNTINVSWGTLNIYGGTVEYLNNDTTAALTLIKSSSKLNMLGGAVVDGIAVDMGTMTLGGTAEADLIGVAAAGKLVVKSDYTGTSRVVFESEITNNTIPEANGVSEGAFAGKLYLEAENSPEIIGEGTKLVVKGVDDGGDEDQHTGDLDLDENGYAQCEHCGESVQWTLVTSAPGTVTDTSKHLHYYLGANFNLTSGSFMLVNNGANVCLHLNGHTITQNGWINVISGTLSIMDNSAGNGRIVGTNTSYNTINVSWGTLNIYGGTVEYLTNGTTSAITTIKSSSKLNMLGGAVVNGIAVDMGTMTLGGDAAVNLIDVAAAGKLTVKADYVGTSCVNFASNLIDNAVPAANGYCEGAFTGKLYEQKEGSAEFVADGTSLVRVGGSGLELDEDGYAQCEHCGQSVQWTAITGGLGTITDTSKHHHYYLTDNTTLNNGSLMLVNGGANVCLHLNNYTLSQKGWINVISGTLSVMDGTAGTGGIIGTHDSYQVFNVSWGTLNIYGGIYQYTGVGDLSTIQTIKSSAKLNVMGGKVIGGIDVTMGTLSLGGKSAVTSANGELTGNISVVSGAKLNIYNDWTGVASVLWPTSYEKGAVISTAEGRCGSVTDGVFTAGGTYAGSLTDETTGRYINGSEGTLVVGETKQEIEDKTLKILGIGNSFTWDSMYLLYDVYKAENPDKDIELAFLHYAGGSLSTHVTNMTYNRAVYSYYKINSGTYAESGKWKLTEKATMLQALQDECWDIVTMQQASVNSPDASTYNEDIGIIRDYVTTNLGYAPEFAWNFTWAYPDDAELLSTNSNANFASTFFTNYGTSANMYAKIRDAVEEKIVNGEYAWDYLMPAGTVIQNAREELTAKQLYRDSLHLNDLGRLIVAYTWYCELEGYNGEDKALTDLKLTTVPAKLVVSNGVTELDDALEQIVIDAVNNAVKNKFAVTTN